MKKHVWPVTKTAAQQTLQTFLAEHLHISRNQAKALLDRREVLVNRRRIWMAHHRLRLGDTVEWYEQTHDAAVASQTAIPVLYDAERLVIANKPAGVLVNGPGGLEEILRRQLARPRLTALHRLDRDTTGCIMFADDAELQARIIALFEARAVVKVYHAIAAGRPDFAERVVNFPVEGQSAETRLRVLDYRSGYAHLQATITTGRTHQIRRHLEALALPLAGDRQYGAGRELSNKEAGIPRQMLHARRILLHHPLQHVPIKAEAPLPADFRRTLHFLGLH